MLGLEIFVHALRMVLRNFKQVLQITIGPALIATLLLAPLAFNVDLPVDENGELMVENLPPSATAFFLAAFAVGFTVFAWIAVAWHRFILLEEYPSGILPRFASDRVLAYFGRVAILFLVALTAMYALSFVFVLLSQIGFLGIIVQGAVYIGFVVCLTRLSIVLPAAAVGDAMTLKEAWAKTEGAGGPILSLVVLSALFQFMVQYIVGMFAIIPVLGILVLLFFGALIIPMFNVSILTTLYGVFVEKRELT